jgi:HD-GYP domain-containing protein (c-di-GMP phosphodiesterase class II)
MTSDRVYRPKRSEEDALGELERCAGTQFDPSIVTAFAQEMNLASVETPTSVAV